MQISILLNVEIKKRMKPLLVTTETSGCKWKYEYQRPLLLFNN